MDQQRWRERFWNCRLRYLCSDNGSDYTLWKHESATTNTDTYSGTTGHTYGFYSIATDNAGNVEAAPASADATTTINVTVLNQVLFDSATGTLSIGGTDGNDTILVGPDSKGKNVQVTLNGHVVSNNIPLTSVLEVEILGHDGADTITINNLAKPISVDGGDGADKLIVNGPAAATAYGLSATTLSVGAASYNFDGVESVAVTAGKGNDTLTVSALPSFAVAFNGGSGTDTLVGPNATNTWIVTGSGAGTLNSSLSFSAVENLTGGTDDDTFNFSAGQKLSGKVDGGTGSDTLTYGTYTKAVTVDLQKLAATNTGGVAHLESFVGGAGKDTLVGSNTVSIWAIAGTNAGSVNGLAFSAFENLTGGTAADNFQIASGATITGKLDGGKSAVNTLDYSGDSAAVSVNLQSSTATGISAYSNIQSLIGGPATTLVGPNKTITWNITGANAGNVNGLSFTGVGTLTGGTQNDTFVFANGASVTGKLDGSAGTDLLNYAAYTTPITVDLAAQTATGTGGIANIESLAGSKSTGDTLIGPNTMNNWNITATNTGTVNKFAFKGVENLTGGALADRFVLANGIGVSGHIDGGAGNNTLDYSKYTSAVSVDLTAGTAKNIGGGVSDVNVVIGGSAGDNFTGSAGRDLLFGGTGTDTLNGSGGDDILFENAPNFASNAATIDSLLTYWNRTDLDYLTRVTQLRAGTTGVAGLPKMNTTIGRNDSNTDTLTGGAGNDWFFAKLSSQKTDKITDLESGEQTN